MFYTADGKLINRNNNNKKIIEHMQGGLCVGNECLSKNHIKVMKFLNEMSSYKYLLNKDISEYTDDEINDLIQKITSDNIGTSTEKLPEEITDIEIKLENKTDVSTHEGNDGEIEISVTGGKEPYTPQNERHFAHTVNNSDTTDL